MSRTLYSCLQLLQIGQSHKDLYQKIMSCFWFQAQHQIGKMNKSSVRKKSFLLSGCEIYIELVNSLTYKTYLQVKLLLSQEKEIPESLSQLPVF